MKFNKLFIFNTKYVALFLVTGAESGLTKYGIVSFSLHIGFVMLKLGYNSD
jgi:hypothetical protein